VAVIGIAGRIEPTDADCGVALANQVGRYLVIDG
jgi:hypothetical protein